MMETPTDERASALAAVDTTCPRCGTPREPDQEYCIECGLRLPSVDGTLPRLRRRWVRRLGWYPGDWIWVSLLTLLVAAAGATGAILLTDHGQGDTSGTFVTPPTASVTDATVVPSTPPTVDTSTLPTPPEPKPKPTPKPQGPPNGRTVWPAGKSGWTIVLNSYPTAGGKPVPLAAASRAARAHLPQVGVLESAHFSSLHPGYYVVFSGVYGSKSASDAALRTARSSGFPSAYTRQISR